MILETLYLKISRGHIASFIADSLEKNRDELASTFNSAKNKIGYFILDDILPEDLVMNIYKSFPRTDDAVLKKNIREHKYVAYQMDKYDKLLEETIYAFQDARVVQLIGEICNLKDIYPDEQLYAGGLSIMKKGNFLNPHLDNSHDKDRNKWRVLNLLYYVTPNWKEEYGGNLELWPNEMSGNQIIIPSKFNRLVVMATHQNSWHSVSKVTEDASRCCVSNYYFSNGPHRITDKFHVTSFRGRPTERLKDLVLQTDTSLRSFLRKFFKKGVRENPHKYQK